MILVKPLLFFVLISTLLWASVVGCTEEMPGDNAVVEEEAGSFVKIPLPQPELQGNVSVEEALYTRISRRSFKEESLKVMEVGQLLWAAGGLSVDGVTGASRTAPSAGGTYPLELYLVVGDVEGIDAGIYHYDYQTHSLETKELGDVRTELARAALRQQVVTEAPASIVMVAHMKKTTKRYGERGIRYVYMDVGYKSQNIYLQAEALSMATVAVGAFDDDAVKELLGTEGAPVMIMPIGYGS